mmetsp:Transcript_63785/g.170900  ORF Transcript_63785/g.170900 Transcript_63785/m.170900 type:complete len:109 (+) Transcript_63785:162-488(+)
MVQTPAGPKAHGRLWDLAQRCIAFERGCIAGSLGLFDTGLFFSASNRSRLPTCHGLPLVGSGSIFKTDKYCRHNCKMVIKMNRTEKCWSMSFRCFRGVEFKKSIGGEL